MTNRYDAVSVREYTDNRSGEVRKVYTRLGAAFPFRQGNGYTIKLDAVPPGQDGQVTILLMEPRQDGERRQQAPQGGGGADLDDEIPF